jgi:hypothetical protein
MVLIFGGRKESFVGRFLIVLEPRRTPADRAGRQHLLLPFVVLLSRRIQQQCPVPVMDGNQGDGVVFGQTVMNQR